MVRVQQSDCRSVSHKSFSSLLTVVAIKQMGGPTIPWSSGRVDALDPSAVTPDGRLPNADSGPKGADKEDAAHLRNIFYRMGFNDQGMSILLLFSTWFCCLRYSNI